MDWSSRPNLVVVSGATGSGKTRLLRQLAALGEQVIDLEALARHQGSAFGGLSGALQPTHREFGDAVLAAWHSTDPGASVWMEDEGPYLGSVGLPVPLQRLMARAPCILVTTSDERRRTRLLAEFGAFPERDLLAAIGRIANRLGVERARTARTALETGDLRTALEPLMEYYDKGYAERARLIDRFVIARVGPDDVAAAAALSAVESHRRAVTAKQEDESRDDLQNASLVVQD